LRQTRSIAGQSFNDLSGSTVKADAARNSFGTSGKNILWAVVDTGIDKTHPHFQKHKNLDLSDPLSHRDFTRGGATDLAASACIDNFVTKLLQIGVLSRTATADELVRLKAYTVAALSREPGGRAYMIGDRLSRFGLEVLRNDAAATERRMVLRRVVSDIQESCNLAVLYKGALIYLDCIEANWPLRLQIPVGSTSMPPHCCASGKLLLAHLPIADRQRLLEVMALERFTMRTITDRQVLSSELDRIVKAGYAVDNEEYVLGVACVAVPVRNRPGEIVAAVAVQGATARLSLMRAIEFVPRLQAAAAEIGSTFG